MAKLQTKTEPKTQLERIAAVHPKYSALLARQAQLTARYDEIIAEVNGPKGRVDGTVNGTTGAVRYNDVPLAEQARRSQVAWVSQAPKPVAKPVVRNEAAVALIGSDLLSPQPEAETNPEPPRPSWNGERRLSELSSELDTIVEALRLIAIEIPKARLEYSLKVAAERGAAHQGLIERIVDISRGLGDALQDYNSFLDDVRNDSAAWRYLKPLDITAFGELNQPHSPLLNLIAQAVERGHVGGGLPQWNPALSLSQLQSLGD
jgi:hypothetical protein